MVIALCDDVVCSDEKLYARVVLSGGWTIVLWIGLGACKNEFNVRGMMILPPSRLDGRSAAIYQ
jgi:hypothetical protein